MTRPEDVEAVLAVLRNADEPMEASDIRRLTDLPHERMYAALVRLEATGKARMLPAKASDMRLWDLGVAA